MIVTDGRPFLGGVGGNRKGRARGGGGTTGNPKPQWEKVYWESRWHARGTRNGAAGAGKCFHQGWAAVPEPQPKGEGGKIKPHSDELNIICFDAKGSKLGSSCGESRGAQNVFLRGEGGGRPPSWSGKKKSADLQIFEMMKSWENLGGKKIGDTLGLFLSRSSGCEGDLRLPGGGGWKRGNKLDQKKFRWRVRVRGKLSCCWERQQ